MIFANQAVSDIFTAFLGETAPAVGVDETTASAVTNMIDSADSTQDVITTAQSAFDGSMILDAIDESIPDDDLAG